MSQIIHQYNGVTLTQNDSTVRKPDPFLTLTSPNKGLSFPNSNFIVLESRTSEFSPTTLGSTKHIYTTPIGDDATALTAYFADWSCTYKTNEGARYTVEVDVPWDTINNTDFNVSTYVTENWEVTPNTDIKPLAVNGILANPFVQDNGGGNYVVLPDVLKIAVQNAYDNKFAFGLPASISSSAVPFIPYATQILNYMRGGIEGVVSNTQQVKRTAIVDIRNSNGAFKKIADAERNSLNAQGTKTFMVSTNDLINKYDVTPATAALLYPSYRKRITVSGFDPHIYYAYAGWLVYPPSCRFITPNKLQYEQSFVWNEWIGGLYYINSNPNDFPLVVNPSANPSGFMPTA